MDHLLRLENLPRTIELVRAGDGAAELAYISKTLFISDNTARTHMRNIYRKLGIGSREELLSLVNGL